MAKIDRRGNQNDHFTKLQLLSLLPVQAVVSRGLAGPRRLAFDSHGAPSVRTAVFLRRIREFPVERMHHASQPRNFPAGAVSASIAISEAVASGTVFARRSVD